MTSTTATQALDLADRLRVVIGRIGLPFWFIVIDLLWVAKPPALGIDARHYQRAANAWMAGGDPYSVFEGAIPYLAGPHTLPFYVPTGFLPLSVAVVVWMAIGIAAGAWTVRRLGLPMWWILFPPLAHSLWNGNPQSLALALLVLGGTVPSALAVAVKLYTGLVTIFRPRLALTAGLLLLVTLPFVPWQAYLDQRDVVVGVLDDSWNGSAWRLPILVPPTVLGLWILRRRGAEWFAVSAVFPLTQFYYVGMTLPALVGRPVLAALLALPAPLMTPLVVIGLAARVVWDGRRRADAPQPDTGG